MPLDQAGVTEEPDADETPGQEKGLFRFIRRKPAKEKRSETEWVDTLQAAPEPEQEEPEESPFMAGEEPEPEPWPEPVPEPREEYRLERKWRRRHKDEMDEIHSYIDRVIGTDRDPLVRHRRLADLGVGRHPSKRREVASVDVEGLDEELMIAFTFPKEELRSARMVYETEGGYVIEVTRAVGGDDDQLERQHYTVSRVGSVAHALDNLRKGNEPRAPAPVRESATNHGRSRGEVPESSGPEPPHEPVGSSEPEEPGWVDEESEESESGKGGLMGFASRFKRSAPETGTEPPEQEGPEPDSEVPPQAEGLGEGEPTEPGVDEEEPAGKKGALGGLASRLKRRGKDNEPESQAFSEEQDASPVPTGAEPEEQETDPSSKRGLLGGLPGLKRRRGTDDADEEDSTQGDSQDEAEPDDSSRGS